MAQTVQNWINGTIGYDSQEGKKSMKVSKVDLANLKSEFEEYSLDFEKRTHKINYKLMQEFSFQAWDMWTQTEYWVKVIKALVYIDRFETFQ